MLPHLLSWRLVCLYLLILLIFSQGIPRVWKWFHLCWVWLPVWEDGRWTTHVSWSGKPEDVSGCDGLFDIMYVNVLSLLRVNLFFKLVLIENWGETCLIFESRSIQFGRGDKTLGNLISYKYFSQNFVFEQKNKDIELSWDMTHYWKKDIQVIFLNDNNWINENLYRRFKNTDEWANKM